jgi:hypothetical protein
LILAATFMEKQRRKLVSAIRHTKWQEPQNFILSLFFRLFSFLQWLEQKSIL